MTFSALSDGDVLGIEDPDRSGHHMLDHISSSIATADGADVGTILSYSVAAVLTARAGVQAELRRERQAQTFWRAVALFMVLLGVNELLDLQTLLTVYAREHAKAAGWYDQRRLVQYAFVITLGSAAIVADIGGLYLVRRASSSIRSAALGLLFIVSFVLIRAASLHPSKSFWGVKGRSQRGVRRRS